ncbi:MAG: hypothetical protein P8J37_18050 [Fuerstiella sp.]|nr:hypothetical protein [Fuerstiella sp.]
MSPSESRRDQTKLEEALRSTKPWFAENGTTLIYALAAVLAVAAAAVFLQRQSSGDVQASRELAQATDPEQYRDIADNEDFSKTTIGIWARLRQGDRLLDNAVGNMFTNREVAIEELAQAKAAYDQLADRPDVDEQVRERVLIGLARVAETRCDGDPETTNAAVKAWQAVLEEFSESIVKKHAEERIEQLQSDESQTFYAWFAKQNPTPDDPGLGPGQSAVPDLPEMPSLHDLTIPESAEGEPADSDSSEKKSSESEVPSNNESPAKPEASTTPAESESASDKKPQADAQGTSGGKDDVKAPGDPAPTPAAENDTASESPDAGDADASAEENKSATDGGDGDK